MDARVSSQISIKLGRPTGRRKTRSRTLDQLKARVCEEVASEIRSAGSQTPRSPGCSVDAPMGGCCRRFGPATGALWDPTSCSVWP